MRMNKQAQAADILKEYITLLSAYEGQGIEGTEKEWTNKEIGWAKPNAGQDKQNIEKGITKNEE